MTLDRDVVKAIEQAAKTLQAEEKFPVPVLAVRAAQAAQTYPHDAPLVTASNVLRKMAETKLFISRKELNSLYDQLYSPNTKLAQVFEVELARPALASATMIRRDSFEDVPLDFDYKNVANPLLSNALEAMFDGSKEERLYSSASAVSAEKSCLHELTAHGVAPKKVGVFAGRDDMIVCQATYETPKGQAHVLVPVELSEGKALLPAMFLSQAGFVGIDSKALSNHIASTAGHSFKVDGEKLLDILLAAKNGVNDVDEVTMAVLAIKAKEEMPAFTENGILYQKVEAEDKGVQDVVLPKNAEEESFAKRLESGLGLANYAFGSSVVDAGKNMLLRKMASFGMKNVQISVADVDNDTIHYAININRSAGVKVPVKVVAGRIEQPTIAFAAGDVDSFTAEGIARLMSGDVVDSRMLAVASPMYGMKAGELMQIVRNAIADGNLHKAEDAIDVLGEVDVGAQKKAMELLLESFNPDTLKKVASEQRGCSRIVKNSSSQHSLCGHLNLPLHKVYQDKHGDCQPLHRKQMEDAGEGAIFMTNKVFI